MFKKLKMEKQPDVEKAKKGNLIPYYLTGINTPLLYNDVQVIPPLKPVTTQTGKTIDKGPTAKTFKVTGIEEWWVSTPLHPHLLRRFCRPNA